MNWRNPWHLAALVVTGLIVVGGWWLLLARHCPAFFGLVLACAAFFLAIVFVVWLPSHLRARRLHGKPAPPLGLQIGMRNDRARAALEQMEKKLTKTRRCWWGKVLNNVLYESVLQNEDGDWHYWAETCNGVLVAFDFDFKSTNSRFLDYSLGYGGGSRAYFLRGDHG